jgi:hypothetical protein
LSLLSDSGLDMVRKEIATQFIRGIQTFDLHQNRSPGQVSNNLPQAESQGIILHSYRDILPVSNDVTVFPTVLGSKVDVSWTSLRY